MTKQVAEIAAIEMELEIAAPPAQVWSALTENIGEWWPAEFYAGGEAGKRSFTLESVPGGRMVETWNAGGGVLWGTVICVQPEVLLQVLGILFPNWGGPSASYGTWELEAHSNGTKLKFSSSSVGHIADSDVAERDKGWRFLCQTLKAYVEASPLPVWQD